MSNNARKTVKVAAAVAFALAAAGGSSLAFAQSSEGSLYGKVAPGSAVTLTSTETGTTRTITADSSGNFSASRLPPGKYTVSSGGKESDVVVTIGGGTQVDLDKALTTVAVTSGRVGAIDFKSTETNFVFTQEQVQALPVALSINSVAALSPTVLKGDSDLGSGNLPSFAGASVAENAYYINGFDVTNIRNFLAYADLPFEAIAQQQVKAGGYGAVRPLVGRRDQHRDQAWHQRVEGWRVADLAACRSAHQGPRCRGQGAGSPQQLLALQ